MEHTGDNRESFQVTLLLPHEERSIRVGADEHIWDAAMRQGVSLPALCHQGWCLTSAARIEGAGEFDQADSVGYYPADREAGYVLLCTCKPRSDLRVRTHQARAMRAHRIEKGLPAPYSHGL